MEDELSLLIRRQDSLRSSTVTMKEEIDNQQQVVADEKKKLEEMLSKYTSSQIEYNELLLKIQSLKEKIVLDNNKKRKAIPQSAIQREEESATELWDSVTASLGHEVETCDPEVLGEILQAQNKSEQEIILFKNKWLEKYKPHHPKLPIFPKSCILKTGYKFFKKTVYGEGTGFLKSIDRSVWTITSNPEEATLIWERDDLKDFKENLFDPRIHCLNKLLLRTQLSFADKSDLCRSINEKYIPKSCFITTPQELVSFSNIVLELGNEDSDSEGVWILKRVNLSSGFGLTIIPNLQSWWNSKRRQLFDAMSRLGHKYLLQKYINNPLLWKLPGDQTGRKFDIRVYFVIVSTDPLIVLYKEGTCRLNAEEYKQSDYSNEHIHISNIARQRTHQDFALVQQNLKKTVPQLQSDGLVCSDEYDSLTGKFKEIIKHVIESHRHLILENAGLSRFELLAADFLIDEKLNVFLLECQTGCALSTDDPISQVQIPILINQTLSAAFEVHQRRANGETLTGLRDVGDFVVLVSEA